MAVKLAISFNLIRRRIEELRLDHSEGPLYILRSIALHLEGKAITDVGADVRPPLQQPIKRARHATDNNLHSIHLPNAICKLNIWRVMTNIYQRPATPIHHPIETAQPKKITVQIYMF